MLFFGNRLETLNYPPQTSSMKRTRSPSASRRCEQLVPAQEALLVHHDLDGALQPAVGVDQHTARLERKAADDFIHQVRHRGAGKLDLRSAADRLRQRRQPQGFDADPHGAYRSPIRSQVSTTLEVTHGCTVASKLLKCVEARWASKAARSV